MGISARDFETMQNRLKPGRRTPTPTPASVSAGVPVRKTHPIILGIDPSLRGTGYGVIHQSRALDFGTIRCSAQWPRSRCLVHILHRLRETITKHRPTVCAIEGLFFAQNLQTALLMGEARGVALAAAAEAGLEIYEIAPRRMKQAIVGYGAAQKHAVSRMVQRLLKLDTEPEPDAADALALALAHSQEQSRYSLTPLKRL